MSSKKGIVLRSMGISMALIAGTVFCFPTPSTARVINNATLSVQVGQDIVSAAEMKGNFFTEEGQNIMLNGDFAEMSLPITISCADLNLEDLIGMTGTLQAVSSDESKVIVSLDTEEVVLGEEAQTVNLTIKLLDAVIQPETEKGTENLEEDNNTGDALIPEGEETSGDESVLEVIDENDTENEMTPVSESEMESISLSDLILEMENQKIKEQVKEFEPLGTGIESASETGTDNDEESGTASERETVTDTEEDSGGETEEVPGTEEGTGGETEEVPGTEEGTGGETEEVPGTEEGTGGETEEVPDTEEGTGGETEEIPDTEENLGNESETTPEILPEEGTDTEEGPEIEEQPLAVDVTFQVGEKKLSAKIVILNAVAVTAAVAGELQFCPSQYYPTEKIKLVGAADAECNLNGFPAMTRYTIEEQSYLLYNDGYITIPAGKEAEVDLSLTEWKEDLILQTGGETAYTIKYVELPEFLEEITPLIVTEEGNSIAITKTWGTIEPIITIEHLTVSEEGMLWEVNEIVAAQFDENGKVQLTSNQAMAGTYRMTVSWIENEVTLYQMEMPFFIQYKSVDQGGTGQ